MTLLNRNTLKLILAITIAGLLVSCETVSYYTQAARGQLSILLSREELLHLLASPDLSPQLREKFTTVLSIRDFAETELHLPVGDNYLTYVDVAREHVIWNVFAAPEFSTDPVNWCFPIAGCVSYRGYFSEAAAERYAERLSARNFDVYTGGVDAYSTLGWFDDSLLSTVSERADYQLAALIFHELSHQVAYLPGDTTFNESFATAVERAGLRQWLLSRDHADMLALAETDRIRQEQFIELVTLYRDKLDALYAVDDMSADSMRERKAQIQDELRTEYVALQLLWDGYAGYDNWFASSLNNAQLSTVSSYNELVPFFTGVLESVDGDFQRFYGEVQRIAELGVEERERLIADSIAGYEVASGGTE